VVVVFGGVRLVRGAFGFRVLLTASAVGPEGRQPRDRI